MYKILFNSVKINLKVSFMYLHRSEASKSEIVRIKLGNAYRYLHLTLFSKYKINKLLLIFQCYTFFSNIMTQIDALH